MPLFRHLTYKEIIRVLNVTEVKEYAPGEDDHPRRRPRATSCSSSCAGKVRLHKNDAFITHLLPGAHIGEMALVDRTPPLGQRHRRGDARACSSCARGFYEIIRKEPPLSVKLLWSFVQVLAERLRKTTAELSGARLEAHAEDLTDDVLFEE